MYFVFLILVVTVSARDISQYYNNEPHQERFDRTNGNSPDNFNNRRQNGFVNTNNHRQFMAPNNRQFVNNEGNGERSFANPNLERHHRDRQESVNYHGQNGFENTNDAEQFNMQNNKEFIPNGNDRNDRSGNPQANQRHFQENLNNHGQLSAEGNRESIPNNNNDRNGRNWNPNTNPGHPHANFNRNEQSAAQNNRDNDRPNAYPGAHDNAGIMSINQGFHRQGNQNRREQSNFNIPRQSFNINNGYSNGDDAKNILQARRQQDEMTLGDYNRETQGSHRNASENQNNNNGIVSFVNHLNNTNQNHDNQPNRNNQRHQSGLKNTDTAYKHKTVIENEVTQNPLGNGNESADEWVWGVEETTTVSTVTIDDRAAFSGDKCAQGLVRFMGKCVPED